MADAKNPAPSDPPSPGVRLPAAGALVARGGQAVHITPDGEIDVMPAEDAAHLLERASVMVCQAPFVARRLGVTALNRRGDLFDLMELYAFVRPARFCIPTPKGLAHACRLGIPADAEAEAEVLVEAAAVLLGELAHPDYPHKDDAAATAQAMARAGWAWGKAVLAALGPVEASSGFGLDVWKRIPEWEERAPQGGSSSIPVDEDAAAARLHELVGDAREHRPSQEEYTRAACHAFEPREKEDEPRILLADAGTGIGKTLGYIAPASLWAEQNGPGVWVSTYTKNLQRQLDQELGRLYPDPYDKARRTVIRKGRENYLCLLNFQEAAERGGGLVGQDAVSLGLVARWARYSRDGDMVGGDFPSWLAAPGLVHGTNWGGGAPGLTDRRGECIYAACPHYRKCFIERAVRKSRHAHIVVANHALVMTGAALDNALTIRRARRTDPDAEDNSDQEGLGGGRLRLIFDEGHHVFDAADSAFAAHLTAQETADLRRWIRGPEGRRRRGRGLADRLSDLIGERADAEEALEKVLKAAHALPTEGWASRLSGGSPNGPAEAFFALVRGQVLARASSGLAAGYSLQAEVYPLSEGIEAAAAELDGALEALAKPLLTLAEALRAQLEDDSETLESATRARLDAAARGLERRGLLLLPAWRGMLKSLGTLTPEEFVDWFALERAFGRDIDTGMHRHYVDPTKPFAEAVLSSAHGAIVTSATLRDKAPETEQSDVAAWEAAESRLGTAHLTADVKRVSLASPFDYAAHTKVLVVTDVSRSDPGQVAGAMRALFEAAGGGALGLFTAIARLRAVYERIAAPLEAAGYSLYAQHVDAMDVGTLVDIFRAEMKSCLLGTDAVRDGVDVPGRSLKLIVFDRVPWPRPDILHRARRERFGGKDFDDRLTRLRLKQAYGRLIRRGDDKGVFVMLDNRTPSRLATAFPEGVALQRVGLAEAVRTVGSFLD